MWEKWLDYQYAWNFAMELFICYVFFVIFYTKRKNFIPLALCSVVGYIAGFSLIWALIGFLPSIFHSFYWPLVCVLLACCTCIPFKTHVWGGVYAVTGAYATQHLTFCLTAIIQQIFKTPNSDFKNFFFIWLMFVLIGGIVFALFILPKRFNVEGNNLNINQLLLSVIIILICVILRDWFRSLELLQETRKYLSIIVNAYGMISCLLVLALQFGLFKQDKLEQEKEQLEKLLTVEQERNQISQETMACINLKCHDLKHQIRLLENGTYEGEKADIIQEIKKNIASYSRIVKTGNETLDLVFIEKLLLCEKYDIHFSYLIDGKQLEFINALDIATLCGNAIDNAIEYLKTVEEKEKRFMCMVVKKENGIVYLHLDNYCDKEIVFENGLPITTKEDKKFHGFGTKSIQLIANKYGGDLNISLENGRYNLDIMFIE